MQGARKRWRLSDDEKHPVAARVEEPGTLDYRRRDGSINLHLFKTEYLNTPEQCALVMGEIDKMREEFGNDVRLLRAQYGRTAKQEHPEKYRSAMTLWNLAKTARNQVQDRRGQLRRMMNLVKTETANISSERRFILSAKQMLDEDVFAAIWENANALEMKPDQPSRDSVHITTGE